MTDCQHTDKIIALWRCIRSGADIEQRPKLGLHPDWAFSCLDCEAYDFVPAEGARILVYNRKTGKLDDRDPR